jgi:hypothetical protein
LAGGTHEVGGQTKLRDRWRQRAATYRGCR